MIIGTAGHIDHGKTALVRALTGIETDRLVEEKRRGMSIDIGFAYMDLPGGERAGIVDVPGHEHFVRNMLAGVQGIDLALLVVAANDGVMPQTREHLDIIDLLGIKKGIVALTKTDLVSEPRLEEVKKEVEDLLQGTSLEEAELLPLSSVTGLGIDGLKGALAGCSKIVSSRKEKGFFRMPVDRVFSLKGIGTVVTGTVISGSIGTGEPVRLFPGGRELRIRQMEAYGEPSERLEAGLRGAINLAGIERSDIRRGDLLASPALKRETEWIDVSVRPARFSKKSIRPGEKVHLHTGTADVIAACFPSEGKELFPGGGYASLKLARPLHIMRGDRFVIRDYSAQQTLGGGAVINPFPTRRAKKENRDCFRIWGSGELPAIVEDLLERAGGVESVDRVCENINLDREALLSELSNSTGIRRAGEMLILEQRLKEIEKSIFTVLEDYHKAETSGRGMAYETLRKKAAGDAPSGLFKEVFEELLERGGVEKEGEDSVRLKGKGVSLSTEEQVGRKRLLAGLNEKGFQTASISELAGNDRTLAAYLGRMVREGEAVQLSKENFISKELLEKSRELLISHFKKKETITVIEFKNILQTGRKGSILILEHFDKTHLTVRKGDERVLTGRREV